MAQSKTAAAPTSGLEVAIVYDASRADGTSFWQQGGSVQLEGRFWRGLGAVADIGGLHTGNMHGSGVGLDMVTATFGPRYSYPLRRRPYSIYGQVLAGEANGFNSAFPGKNGVQTVANSLALLAGGGVNLHLKNHLSARLVEVDWLRTQVPNGSDNVQNDLRLGAGLVWRFK